MSHWVIAGASGIVGRRLLAELNKTGEKITILSRSSAPEQRGSLRVVNWDPTQILDGKAGGLKPIRDALEDADVLVNLAGSSLAEGRLNKRHQEAILGSRLMATQCLVAAYQAAQSPPPRWLQASAVGYYGDTGPRVVTETDGPGDLFLSQVCRLWEQAAEPAVDCGAQMVLMRLGLVLDPEAPAFKKMLLPIKLGAGGRLGSGKQIWAWISGEDIAQALVHLGQNQVVGPINLVAPQACGQIELTKALCQALGRPSLLPAPSWALRLVGGGVADELLLPSCQASCQLLKDSGFEFTHPNLETLIPWLLKS